MSARDEASARAAAALTPSRSFGEPTLVETFRRIRQRSSARESLQAQLGALSKGQLVSLAPLAAELPEVTPQTVLSKFAAEGRENPLSCSFANRTR